MKPGSLLILTGSDYQVLTLHNDVMSWKHTTRLRMHEHVTWHSFPFCIWNTHMFAVTITDWHSAVNPKIARGTGTEGANNTIPHSCSACSSIFTGHCLALVAAVTCLSTHDKWSGSHSILKWRYNTNMTREIIKIPKFCFLFPKKPGILPVNMLGQVQ